MKLTRENYIEVHQLAVLTAGNMYRLVKDLPLRELMERIDRAEAVGPILDPTLYRDKSKALGEDKKMIKALRAFQSSMDGVLK